MDGGFKMQNKEITFIALTTKKSENVLQDVVIDFEKRNYTIETVDQNGRMVQEPVEGRLRRTAVRKYQEELETLDIVSWPLLDESPAQSFPTILENSVVLYVFEDNGEEYYTKGRENDDLVKLHQATEHLVNTTFGSYEYY